MLVFGKKLRPYQTIVASAVLLSTVTPALAALNTYSSRSAFLSAVDGSLAIANFEGLGNTFYQTLNSGIEASIPAGVTFSPTSPGMNCNCDLYVALKGFNGNTAIATDSLFTYKFGTPLYSRFIPNVTAVGANVIAYNHFNQTAQIAITIHDTTNVDSIFYVQPPHGASTFFGVIATGGTTIDQISYISGPGFMAGIDDFVFGNVVPEPSTLPRAPFACATPLSVRRKSVPHNRV